MTLEIVFVSGMLTGFAASLHCAGLGAFLALVPMPGISMLCVSP